MMSEFNEFPFTCEFYSMRAPDPDDFYGKEEKVSEYLGACDIQLTNEGIGLVAQSANYTVFIPAIPKMKIDAKGYSYMSIDKGVKFVGNQYGREVLGDVVDISISQLGNTAIFIKSQGI